MNVDLSIAVYQSKAGGQLHWTTIGLGDLNETVRGQSAVKTQRRLVNSLRKKIIELEGGELERFQLRRGVRLHRTRMELSAGQGMGRTRVTGVFPLIAEPRRASDEQRVLVVYHPLRQDEWLFVEYANEIPEAAQAFFRSAWKHLEPHVIEGLRTEGKDSIKPVAFSATAKPIDAKKEEDDPRRRRRERNVLAQIGTNQTTRAIEGTLALGMPRQAQRKRMWQLMSGTKMTSCVVVGEPKSGKSTVIAQWVADLLEGDDYATHHSLDRIHKVWSVSGKRLIAGMSHLGDWEQRCLDLLEEVKKTRAILWVDDIHLWGKLGQSRESERCFADFFRGPVARGEVVVVAECTREQLVRLEDDAASFAKLLTRVRVPPATEGETLQMLVHEGSRLELDTQCRIHPFTYRTILEMSASLFPWSALPGKAVDMLRALAEPSLDVAPSERAREIEHGDVVDHLSRQTGLPQTLLTLDEALDVPALRAGFAARVMGQPQATTAATDLVCRIRAGLTDPKRPYAVLLFTGPTGTGKTELAKQIAQFLYGDISRLVRFDMSEYAGADAVPRLIGDRFAPAGQLTQRIREQPFSVLLLDEIEKAHRSVLNLLLQLFDDARLTDAAGDTTSFASTVIIMTSNLGAKPSRPVGFGDVSKRVLADIERAVAEFFPPELFNRIDRIVPFAPLSSSVAEAVVVKELSGLFGRRGVKERNIFVYAADAVKKRIVEEAFDERWGARTVKRYLEDRIASLLSEYISAHGASSMQVIRLFATEDERSPFRIHTDPLEEAEPHGQGSELEPLLDAPTHELAAYAMELARRLVVSSGQREVHRDRARHAPSLRYYMDWYDERVREVVAALGGDAADARAEMDARTWATVAGERLRLRPQQQANRSREELLGAIGEGSFLAANVHALGDARAHEARIELLSVGERPQGGRGRGLLGDLVEAFSALVEVTAVASQGPLTVLDVAGFAVRAKVAPEQGCHIRRSVAAEPDIVRVRVLDADGDPEDLLSAHEQALAAFDAALEAGHEPLPVNPVRLLPAVRTLAYDVPLRAGAPMAVQIEDFREAYAATVEVKSLTQAIARIWLLRAGRGP